VVPAAVMGSAILLAIIGAIVLTAARRAWREL